MGGGSVVGGTTRKTVKRKKCSVLSGMVGKWIHGVVWRSPQLFIIISTAWKSEIKKIFHCFLLKK